MTIEIKIPELGESISEATIGKWLKNPGDKVEADEPIVALETDKVAIEVPAPSDGFIGKHLAVYTFFSVHPDGDSDDEAMRCNKPGHPVPSHPSTDYLVGGDPLT